MILFMWIRRLPYICAALTPAFLLIVLAINGRFFVSPWTTPEYGPQVSKDIAAYAPVVRYSYLYSESIAHLQEPYVSELSDKWLTLHRSGKLLTIEPIAATDDGSSGVRQEIELSRRMIMASLIRIADKNIRAENFDTASKYLKDALEIANIAKYNSPMSIAGSASMQCEAIKRYEMIQLKVSLANQKDFDNAILLMDVSPERIKQFAARFGALSQVNAAFEETQLPSANEMRTLISNDRAMANAEFDSPESNLFMQTLRVAYDLEVRLDQLKSRYRMTATKNQSESGSILHPSANSG